MLWADFDGQEWQDEPEQKRKGAQAVVPIARRAAAAIANGSLVPQFERMAPGHDSVRVVYMTEEAIQGRRRQARAICEISWPEGRGAPEVPKAKREGMAKMMRDLGDALHAGIHDPRNLDIFGVWRSAVSRPRPA